MKIKITLLIAFFAVQTAYAQIGAGDIFAGGAFEISTNDIENRFRIAPTAFYLMSDNLAIGGSIGFATSRNNLGEDIYARSSITSIAPAIRYFHSLSDQLYLYGQGSIGLGFGGTKGHNGNDSVDLSSETTFNIGVRPGLMFLPSPKFGIDFGINFLSFRNTSITDETSNVTTKSSSFYFGLNTLAPSLGIYYFFNK